MPKGSQEAEGAAVCKNKFEPIGVLSGGITHLPCHFDLWLSAISVRLKFIKPMSERHEYAFWLGSQVPKLEAAYSLPDNCRVKAKASLNFEKEVQAVTVTCCSG